MRLYTRVFDDVYGFVYMLAPKDDTLHIKQIWLPTHLQSEYGVCHYEVSFEAYPQDDDMKNRWVDGLPELLLNLSGDHKNIVWTADENVLKIEHSNDWEFGVLIEVAKNFIADPIPEFDIETKFGCGVLANARKS